MSQNTASSSSHEKQHAHSTGPKDEDDTIRTVDQLSEEEISTCLKDADELKKDGNEQFREKQWNEALATYRSALGRLPKRNPKATSTPRKGKGREALDTLGSEGPEFEARSSVFREPSPEPLPEPEPTALEVECAKARAILNANIGACHVKLGEHKEAVAACTEALKDDPQYIKVLQRRAASNDILDTWSSLSSAQEDYNKLLTLLPASSPQIAEIRRTLQTLKPRVEAAQKRETGEMIDKLKGLGNSILGNFGLSTDNFQFVSNGQGGYSVNFVN